MAAISMEITILQIRYGVLHGTLVNPITVFDHMFPLIDFNVACLLMLLTFILIGGEGEVGKVVKLVTWNNNSYRGGVQIKWKSMSDIKTFRLGGEGCVDVIYTRVTENASGGNYYPEHLPRVGM